VDNELDVIDAWAAVLQLAVRADALDRLRAVDVAGDLPTGGAVACILAHPAPTCRTGTLYLTTGDPCASAVALDVDAGRVPLVELAAAWNAQLRAERTERGGRGS